jgi:hypothetical protein
MPRDVHQNRSAIPEGGRSRRRPHSKPTLQYIVQTFEPAPSQKERPAPVPGADGTPDDLFTLGMKRVRSRIERRRRSSRASPVRRTLISLHVLLTFGRLNLPSVTGAGHQESPMVLETEDGIVCLTPVFRPATVISNTGTPRTWPITRPPDARCRLLFSAVPTRISLLWMLTMSSLLTLRRSR